MMSQYFWPQNLQWLKTRSRSDQDQIREDKLKTIRVTITAAAIAAIVGCGSGSSSSSGGGSGWDPNGTITISNLSVTGTSASVAGVAPINPGVNGGQFSVTFNAAGTALPQYSAYMYTNATGVYNANDPLLLGWNCGKTTAGGDCATTVTTQCAFDNSNMITCANLLGGNFPTRDLTTFLSTGIPKNAYIVVHACNALLTACSDQAVPVQYQ